MGNFIMCPTYPEAQPWKILNDNQADGVCDGVNVISVPCANDIDELVCLIADAESVGCDKVMVCDGSDIDFTIGITTGLETSRTIIVPDGMTIECEGCDCTLERTWFSVFYSLCPYFTTEIGGNIDLKGFSYITQPDVPSMENVISFSDYSGVGLDMPIDINVDSSFYESDCGKGKGGKGGKGACAGGKGDKRGRGRARRTRGVESSAFPIPEDLIKQGLKAGNKKGRRVANKPESQEGGDRRLNDPCDSNPVVQLFHDSDADGDGRLTCIEAEVAFAHYSIVGVNCAGMFTNIANSNACLTVDSGVLQRVQA